MLEVSSLEINDTVAAFADSIKLEEFLAILFHHSQVSSMHNLGTVVSIELSLAEIQRY